MGEARRMMINLIAQSGAGYEELVTQINQMLEERGNVSDAFSTVLKSMFYLNGGVGNLSGAADSVDNRRVNTDEKSQSLINNTMRKIQSFVNTAERVDDDVKRKIQEELKAEERRKEEEKRKFQLSLIPPPRKDFLMDIGSHAFDNAQVISKETPEDRMAIAGITAGAALIGVTAFSGALSTAGSALMGFIRGTGAVSVPYLTFSTGSKLTVGLAGMTRGAFAFGAFGGLMNLVHSLFTGASAMETLNRTVEGAFAGMMAGSSWGLGWALKSVGVTIIGKLITSVTTDALLNLRHGQPFDEEFLRKTVAKATVSALIDAALFKFTSLLTEGFTVQSRSAGIFAPPIKDIPKTDGFLFRQTSKTGFFGTLQSEYRGVYSSDGNIWVNYDVTTTSHFTFRFSENLKNALNWSQPSGSTLPGLFINYAKPSAGDVFGRGIYDDSFWGIFGDQFNISTSFADGKKTVE